MTADTDRAGLAPRSGPRAGHSSWAVVEVRSDGTLGRPRIVAGPGPADSPSIVGGTGSPMEAAQVREVTPLLHAHLGSLHLTTGSLHRAADAFSRGYEARSTSGASVDCLARLAHVEAMQGDLRRASRHAGLLGRRPADSSETAVAHAGLARAWVALERADFVQARRVLRQAASMFPAPPDPWLATSHLLLDANLLIAEGDPHAAIRTLADGSELATTWPKDWLSDLVTTTKAHALLASGEPQRAIAAVTPMPTRAVAEAAVVMATARHEIRDARGANAVLSRVVGQLDQAPRALQIQAWLLEGRLGAERGKLDRARLLVDRSLRSATTEQLRLPLVRDWRWLRSFVDRDPALSRAHRDFLGTCQLDDAAPRLVIADSGPELLGATLTQREGQVLELLALMYSTDEIAAALFVSSNTVKTHLKGIFSKLCVNRRVEAVRRGRQLGLC